MGTKFGENLRRIRVERKMSQEELANLLGTSKQVISRYENCQRSPKVSVVGEYAEKLGVSIAELTGEEARTNDEEAELMEYLEELRRNPELRMMFSLTKGATKADVQKAVAVVRAMLGKDDGDA